MYREIHIVLYFDKDTEQSISNVNIQKIHQVFRQLLAALTIIQLMILVPHLVATAARDFFYCKITSSDLNAVDRDILPELVYEWRRSPCVYLHKLTIR